MTSILLASDASALIEKAIKPGKTAFISTAADTYKNKWWIKQDKKILTKKGFRLKEIRLNRKLSLSELREFDIIYLAGGNTFYLLQKMRESGFRKIAGKLMESGVAYVGSSAGAAVAGPNIRCVRFLDDTSKSNLKSFKGLGLVDFIPLPYFGNKKYAKQYEKVMLDLEKTRYKYMKIKENQAVFVKNGKIKIVV